MKLDLREFRKGYIAEYEKHAFAFPNMSDINYGVKNVLNRIPGAPGVINGIEGLADTAGLASTGRVGMENTGIDAVLQRSNNMLKMDPKGNMNVNIPGVASNVGGQAMSWIKGHPLMTGGLALGALSLPFLLGGLGGHKQTPPPPPAHNPQAPAPTSQNPASAPSFFPKG